MTSDLCPYGRPWSLFTFLEFSVCVCVISSQSKNTTPSGGPDTKTSIEPKSMMGWNRPLISPILQSSPTPGDWSYHRGVTGTTFI